MHKPVLDENGQRLNGIRREKLRRTKDLRVLDVQAHVSSEELVHRPVRLDIGAVDGMEAKLYTRLYCPDIRRRFTYTICKRFIPQ